MTTTFTFKKYFIILVVISFIFIQIKCQVLFLEEHDTYDYNINMKNHIDIEQVLEDYFSDNFETVLEIWSKPRPEKPNAFRTYRKSLPIDPFYITDHHMISYQKVNAFFKTLFNGASDSIHRKQLIELLAIYINSNEMVRKSIESISDSHPLDIFKCLRTFLVWNPGNLIPGPEPRYRSKDPGDNFDEETYDQLVLVDPSHSKIVKSALDLVSNASSSEYESNLEFLNYWINIFPEYEIKIYWDENNGKYTADCRCTGDVYNNSFFRVLN
jgi:hypothetical protein